MNVHVATYKPDGALAGTCQVNEYWPVPLCQTWPGTGEEAPDQENGPAKSLVAWYGAP